MDCEWVLKLKIEDWGDTVVFRLVLERRSPAPVLFACSGGYGDVVMVETAVCLLLAGRSARVHDSDKEAIRCALAEESPGQ